MPDKKKKKKEPRGGGMLAVDGKANMVERVPVLSRSVFDFPDQKIVASKRKGNPDKDSVTTWDGSGKRKRVRMKSKIKGTIVRTTKVVKSQPGKMTKRKKELREKAAAMAVAKKKKKK